MKRIFLSLAGLLMLGYAQNSALASGSITSAPEDTIIITMPDKSKMMIYVKDKKDLAKFQSYNVDSLISSLSAYLNVSPQPGADTTLTLTTIGKNGSNQKVNVVVAGSSKSDIAQAKAIASLKRQIELMDNSIATLDKQRNNKALNTQERESINSGMQSLVKEKEALTAELKTLQAGNKSSGSTSVSLSIGNGGTNVTVGNGSIAKQDTIQKKFKPWYNEFSIDLGFNAFHDNERYQNPTGELIDYDLRPFGSRYVSLNWVTGSVIGGKNSPFRIQSGVEFNFNNFMWDNNIRISTVEQKAVFTKEEEINLAKSKLAVTYLTVPLMAGVQFKNSKGKDGFRLMAGGYAGYRIGTHSKIKYSNAEGDTKKDKDRSSFGLQDYQYGVSAQIGYRNFVLFTKYNLSDLFKEDRGPQAQVVNFGITF